MTLTPLFDERFRSWGWEDFHLGHRLIRDGFTNTRVNGAAGVHLRRQDPFELRCSLMGSASNLRILADDFPDDAVIAALTDVGTDDGNTSASLDVFKTLWNSVTDLAEDVDWLHDPTHEAVSTAARSLFDLLCLQAIGEGLASHSAPDRPSLAPAALTAARHVALLERRCGLAERSLSTLSTARRMLGL